MENSTPLTTQIALLQNRRFELDTLEYKSGEGLVSKGTGLESLKRKAFKAAGYEGNYLTNRYNELLNSILADPNPPKMPALVGHRLAILDQTQTPLKSFSFSANQSDQVQQKILAEKQAVIKETLPQLVNKIKEKATSDLSGIVHLTSDEMQIAAALKPHVDLIPYIHLKPCLMIAQKMDAESPRAHKFKQEILQHLKDKYQELHQKEPSEAEVQTLIKQLNAEEDYSHIPDAFLSQYKEEGDTDVLFSAFNYYTQGFKGHLVSNFLNDNGFDLTHMETESLKDELLGDLEHLQALRGFEPGSRTYNTQTTPFIVAAASNESVQHASEHPKEMSQAFQLHEELKSMHGSISVDEKGQPQPTFEQLKAALQLVNEKNPAIIAHSFDPQDKILASMFMQGVLGGPAILNQPLPTSESMLTFKGLEKTHDEIEYSFESLKTGHKTSFADWFLDNLSKKPSEEGAELDRTGRTHAAIALFYSDLPRDMFHIQYKGVTYQNDPVKCFNQVIKKDYLAHLADHLDSEHQKTLWFLAKLGLEPTPESLKQALRTAQEVKKDYQQIDVEAIIASMTFSEEDINRLQSQSGLSKEEIELMGLAKGLELMLIGTQSLRASTPETFAPDAKVMEGYQGIRHSLEYEMSHKTGFIINSTKSGLGIETQPYIISDDFSQISVNQEYDAMYATINTEGEPIVGTAFRFNSRMEYPSLMVQGQSAKLITFENLRLAPDAAILDKLQPSSIDQTSHSQAA